MWQCCHKKEALCLLARRPEPFTVTLTITMPFEEPRKSILTPEQLAYFQQSETYQDIIGFIEELNECVVGVKLTDECALSPVCE